ncbi:MAG: YeeE/YedE family protein [Planctomycetaceae bacterium]|nr:YeeE/YedE family protein [Planctomycetaceae bacterium]
MIETFFGNNALAGSTAMLAALAIGLAFGFALERAGFGSSRRLAGIFYLRDMAVLKVMFTAVIVAMLGLLYARGLGWIDAEQLFFMPSIYGAQIAGGLILGVGFVVGAWCPGTAAVGLASGRWDAAVFLGGTVLGSILFNEMFGLLKGLYAWGDSGVQFAWQSLGMSAASFAAIFVLVAIGCFWGAEYIERRVAGTGVYWRSPFLKAFSVAMVVLAVGLLAIDGGSPTTEKPTPHAPSEAALLAQIAEAKDHMEPEELADRIMAAEAGLFLVDIRPAEEFEAFNIRGAVNIEMAGLPAALAPYKNRGLIVLYSNGMTHPAQARDALARMGYANVYMLTDGLEGFRERVLKPASLRTEPLSIKQTAQINSWRHYFMGDAKAPAATPVAQLPLSLPTSPKLPGLVEPAWLAGNLGKKDVRVLDVRQQPLYNTAHIQGSVCVSPEHFRGVVGGVSSMLLPSDVLARHMSLLGIRPTDTVVIVPDDKPHDATLVSMAFARLGHSRYGILNGGFARWTAEKHAVTKDLPAVEPSDYPIGSPDRFTVDYRQVREHLDRKDTVIIDVRPTEFYTGQKIEEARGGHIPGAKNRPYTEDVTTVGGVTLLRSIDDLANAYARLIPSKDMKVIVHCRTGHQASQTFFVIRNLLGYSNVLWYDGGWSEWSARSELPAVQEKGGK